MYKTNKDEYTYSKYAQISDLMRYEIVYNEGGFYFDANMFLVKDISQLFNTKTKFIGCNELSDTLQHSPILSNSFFGSIPKSPILKRLLSKSFLDSMDLRTLDVDFVTGPGALRSVIKSSDNYTMLPSKTFYPYIMPWTPDGGDHPLRKSHKSKCSGSKQTKKRTLMMKPGLWLEFPCHKYKGTYGIKVWESGGSWTRPQKWYEQSGTKRYSVYQSGGNDNNKGGNNKRGIEQKGGVAPAAACVPCMANPIGMGVTVAGACAYGINEIYKCSKKKGLKKKGSKKKGSKKKRLKRKGFKRKRIEEKRLKRKGFEEKIILYYNIMGRLLMKGGKKKKKRPGLGKVKTKLSKVKTKLGKVKSKNKKNKMKNQKHRQNEYTIRQPRKKKVSFHIPRLKQPLQTMRRRRKISRKPERHVQSFQ